MKVAFISYDFGEYCMRLASALSQETQICLFLPEQLANPYLSLLNPDVKFYPFHKPRLRQPIQQVRNLFSFIRQLKAFDPDLIHIQQGHFWFNLSLPLLKQYPLVVTIHDPKHHTGDRGAHKTPQKIFDMGFQRASQIIVHARQMAQLTIDELRIPEEVIHIIPHIVLGGDMDQQHVDEDENMVLFFGRIWEYKGLEYLIRAEPLITEAIPDVKIVIAGQGEDFSRYRKMMVNKGKFVVYNDYVSDEKRTELFRQASLVVLPYIEATQSGVIPLAYTYSKPVVATTAGGLPEMVDDCQTGYLVPPRDYRALADAIKRLLLDKSLRRQFGKAGKRKIKTECSPEVVAQKTNNVYRLTIK